MPRIPIKLPKTPRARKRGDDARNARRRYERRAERLFKQAMQEGGTAGERAKLLAESYIKDAARLYEKKADADRLLSKYKISELIKPSGEKTRKRLIADSFKITEKALKNRDTRRATEAKELMRGPVGRAIYSATRDIWMDDESDVQDMASVNRKLMDAFGVASMADVIDEFEREFGEDLYKVRDDEDTPSSETPLAIAAAKFARRALRNGRQ